MKLTSEEAASRFGFTNDKSRLLAVRAYRDAAVADGWSIRATYDGHETQERAAHLERDGYVISILSRTHTNMRWNYECMVSIWGPDKLAIHPPDMYDMALIERGMKTCHYCGLVVDVITRVAFAGRACVTCAPAAKGREEFPGWCN